tara:strand:+ start:3054 stop:3551 length:498 start_codon:yes stop_codon:yes gene_type:complete
MSVFGVDTFSKTFNASIVADVVGKLKGGANKLLPPNVKPVLPKPEEPIPEKEEEPVDVDDGTITDDSTEEEPVDSSGDGESSTVEEEEEEEEEQDDSAIGGGGSYEETDSEPLQGAIGGAISSAIDGFLMKALLGVGVIMGAGYAYENREEIKGYFKSVSKGKVA